METTNTAGEVNAIQEQLKNLEEQIVKMIKHRQKLLSELARAKVVDILEKAAHTIEFVELSDDEQK